MTEAEQIKSDIETLRDLPAFQRFLFRHTIQNGGIFDQISDGAQGRNLAHFEGRRDLALEMLAEVEAAQPVTHASGIPLLTTIQIMREAAQSAPTEKRKNERPDRYRDLGDDEPDGVA